MFNVKTPKRTYYLVAENEAEMNKWVDAVCQVCGLKAYTQDEDQQCQSNFNSWPLFRTKVYLFFISFFQCFSLSRKNRLQFLQPVPFLAPTFLSASAFRVVVSMTLAPSIPPLVMDLNRMTLQEEQHHLHLDLQPRLMPKASSLMTSGLLQCLALIGKHFLLVVSTRIIFNYLSTSLFQNKIMFATKTKYLLI